MSKNTRRASSSEMALSSDKRNKNSSHYKVDMIGIYSVKTEREEMTEHTKEKPC